MSNANVRLFATIALAAFLAPFVLGFGTPRVARAQSAEPAFLVLAPDRGFLGNEETQDLLTSVREQLPNVALAFATHEKTRNNLEVALSGLRGGDPHRKVVVLPLFISANEALYRAAAEILVEDPNVTVAEPFGTSYLAEETLFDQIEKLLGERGHADHGAGSPVHLVVLADGAADAADASAIRADLEPLSRRAVERFGLSSGAVTVLTSRRSDEGREAFAEAVAGIREASQGHGDVLLVPLNFGLRLTTMMSHWNWVEMGLHHADNVVKGEPELSAHPNVRRWLLRSAAAYSPLSRDEIGVIFVPHGSDYNWNEMMRQGLAPLRQEYVTEDAFSMVDSYVVERAVRKLEDRGMKAAVVVRIFSLESSFKEQAEYILGLQAEPPAGGHMGMPDRIESHLLFHTLGGVEAHPRFSQALIDRIHEISTEPSLETVILLAHGTGDDAENDYWMKNLETIADYIRRNDPNTYRAIKFHTWREDWPEKRAVTIPEIRAMIEAANEDGGAALVIPVRTNEQGPARSLVPDLDFRYGYGFAPHPEFTEWTREQIEAGIDVLTDSSLRRALVAADGHER